MIKLLLLIPTLLLIAGPAFARDYEISKRVGKFQAEVKINRNPLIVGDNKIEIEIKDDEGKSVRDAEVLVNYYMPPMPRMAPMNYTTKAQLKGGIYKATMKFIMSGPWTIAIKLNQEGKRGTVKFNVDAQ
jgi:hypothetical protein